MGARLALAFATHYFAVFLVAAEAAVLLLRVRPRRLVLAACVPVVAGGLALLPLALRQRSNGSWISETPLLSRVAQVPKQFLVGLDGPVEAVTAVIAASLALLGVALLVLRGDQTERAGARTAAVVAAGAVIAPLVLTVAGLDLFNARNVLAIWVPAAVVVATGLGARRAGLAGAAGTAGLCGLSLAIVASVAMNQRFQRDDWRGAAAASGVAVTDRAVVVTPALGAIPLNVYSPSTRASDREVVEVREIELVAMAQRKPGQLPQPPAPVPLHPVPPGFGRVSTTRTELFTLALYRSPEPVRVRVADLARSRLESRPAAVLLEPGR